MVLVYCFQTNVTQTYEAVLNSIFFASTVKVTSSIESKIIKVVYGHREGRNTKWCSKR